MDRTQRLALAASQRWIEDFNAGDLEACVAGYAESAVLRAKRSGGFNGRAQIEEYWRPFFESGAGELEYTDVKLQVLEEGRAALSARWSTNVGRGVTTLELWVEQADGVWRMEKNELEVLDRRDPRKRSPRIAPERTALLLVDVQNDYFSGGALELEGMEAAAARAARLLAFFREYDLPRYHIRHLFPNREAPFFVPGTSGALTHASVEPVEPEAVVVKNYANSFRETELLGELRTAGILQVVLAGAMSHMCVDATVRAAADLGFSCIVAHDACATRDVEFGGRTVAAADVHAAYMSALAYAYADVLPTDEVLERLAEAGPRKRA